ncbi:dTMP kinase [Ligilactobacillus sp. LYQ135]
MKGNFITFEGLDGSGKTTVIRNIINFLSDQQKKQFVFTREPGGNQISEAIRNIILDQKNTQMDVRTEALLYAAARRQHMVETVFPALNAGKIVLSDRYVDSSLAYQGAGRQIGVEAIAQINAFATENLVPDLTFYFEIEPEIGLQRIQKNRTDEINRLDQEKIEFYKRVHEEYLTLAKQNSQRIKVIDASQSIEQVTSNVLDILVDFLNLKE